MSDLYETSPHGLTSRPPRCAAAPPTKSTGRTLPRRSKAWEGRTGRRSATAVIVERLLKWTYQPERRSSGWRGSIVEARQQIAQPDQGKRVTGILAGGGFDRTSRRLSPWPGESSGRGRL